MGDAAIKVIRNMLQRQMRIQTVQAVKRTQKYTPVDRYTSRNTSRSTDMHLPADKDPDHAGGEKHTEVNKTA